MLKASNVHLPGSLQSLSFADVNENPEIAIGLWKSNSIQRLLPSFGQKEHHFELGVSSTAFMTVSLAAAATPFDMAVQCK